MPLQVQSFILISSYFIHLNVQRIIPAVDKKSLILHSFNNVALFPSIYIFVTFNDFGLQIDRNLANMVQLVIL